MRRIGQYLGLAALLGIAAWNHHQCRRRNDRPRPQGVHRHLAAKLFRHAEHAQAHAVLRDGVGDVVLEPLRSQIHRR